MVNPCQKRSKRPCPEGNKGPTPQRNKGPSPQRCYDPSPQGNTDDVKAEDRDGEADDIQENRGNEENVSTEFLNDVCKVGLFEVVDEHLNSELVYRLHSLGVHS
jgi:hypothetical protein